MTGIRLGVLFVLLSTIFATAISIVHVTHQQRILFIELQQLENEKSKSDIEWDKLLLEENTFSSTASSKKIALLKMRIPDNQEIIFIKANPKNIN